MQVKDIMSTMVVSVAPGTTVLEVAALLLRERVSAVPVLDCGELVGMVSEADLMHRHEIGTTRVAAARPWWVRLFAGEQSPAGYVEAHAAKVSDIMTSPAVSVSEEAAAVTVAELFEARGLRRVPVVRAGQVVGIVSRSDLVRAFAASARPQEPARPTSDAAIRHALLGELESQPWWRPNQSHVAVIDGVVHYHGLTESANEIDAARVAAENVPGVRRVEDHRVHAAGSQWGF
ncbi:MAG TPA: CBS domain-containing protein [Burkholderiaceae bacterium]|nr:CBS domain-containing protein [Burkholderiaceae bacterium]